jgi:ribonuclease E
MREKNLKFQTLGPVKCGTPLFFLALCGGARWNIKMKRMLINATQPEELRVAIVDGQTLYDLDIEISSREQKKANIYKAKVTRVEPSLEAAFVDYGAGRHGFLPLKEVSSEYFKDSAKKTDGRVQIKDALKEGQEIVVQVEKEERGNKGAALTTFISLAGRYLVLMPNNSRAGGVSRRIEGDDRQQLKDALRQIDVPKEMGLIVRTAGVGRDHEELQWDLDYLNQLWQAIQVAAAERSAPFLIYQESNLIIRALRDYLRGDIGEILIDSEAVFNDAREFVQQVMPHNLAKLKRYEDATTPLFSRYQIESQIESAFAREVRLPAGGSIVIDHTEALISIDINSARATKGADIEETALNTNLEAADEVARQLRIRDIGGLIVIDFIDMMDNKHQRRVEERLRLALRRDRARVQTGRISKFGLMEMSRQRLRPSLEEATQNVCPRCDGHGRIRSIESLALSVLRLLEEEVMKEFTGEVIALLPTSVANFLLNEKRHAISEIEQRNRVPVMVVANEYMETPKFEIRRIRRSELRLDGESSYELVAKPEQQEVVASNSADGLKTEAPAVARVPRAQPAPDRSTSPDKKSMAAGFMGWLGSLFASEEKPEKKQKPGPKKGGRPSGNKPRSGQRAQGRSGGRQQQRRGQKKPQQDGAGKQQQGGKQSRSNHPSQRRGKKPSPAQAQGSKAGEASGNAKPGAEQPGGQGQQASKDGNAAENQNRSKRRGRRGGRRRRKSPAQANPEAQQQSGQSQDHQQQSGGNQQANASGRKETGADQATTDKANQASTHKPEKREGKPAEQRSAEQTVSNEPRPAVEQASSGAAKPSQSTPNKSSEGRKSAAKPDAGSAQRPAGEQVSKAETAPAAAKIDKQPASESGVAKGPAKSAEKKADNSTKPTETAASGKSADSKQNVSKKPEKKPETTGDGSPRQEKPDSGQAAAAKDPGKKSATDASAQAPAPAAKPSPAPAAPAATGSSTAPKSTETATEKRVVSPEPSGPEG